MRAVIWATIGRRAGCVTRMAEALRISRRRIRARRGLARIDIHTLRDVGIDPVAVQYEALRPFWVADRRLCDI